MSDFSFKNLLLLSLFIWLLGLLSCSILFYYFDIKAESSEFSGAWNSIDYISMWWCCPTNRFSCSHFCLLLSLQIPDLQICIIVLSLLRWISLPLHHIRYYKFCYTIVSGCWQQENIFFLLTLSPFMDRFRSDCCCDSTALSAPEQGHGYAAKTPLKGAKPFQ